MPAPSKSIARAAYNARQNMNAKPAAKHVDPSAQAIVDMKASRRRIAAACMKNRSAGPEYIARMESEIAKIDVKIKEMCGK